MKTTISPARTAAYKILYDVIENKAFSNISVNNNVNLNMNNPADRALAVNITYGTLKKYNRLAKIFSTLCTLPENKVDKKTRLIILMSVYQMFYLERVPLYAVVNDAVNMAKFYVGTSAAGFTNAILRNADRKRAELMQRESELNRILFYEYGFPEWVSELLIRDLGKEGLLETAKCFEQPSEVTIRTNTAVIGRDKLIQSLSREGIQAEPTYVPCGLKISSGASNNIFRTNAFRNGEFFAQDLSGMIASYALEPKKTDNILDICAAPGAKSFGAAILSGGASVTACDNNNNKLGLLRQSALQLKLNSIKTKRRDSSLAPDPQKEEIILYDKIIADVPCSGLGVIGRKPEILMNITPEHIENLKKLSYKLLVSNSLRLKKGGTILFSTCTLNSDENERIVERFLSNTSGFTLEPITLPFELNAAHEELKDGLLKLSPKKDNCDGFFIAKLKAVD